MTARIEVISQTLLFGSSPLQLDLSLPTIPPVLRPRKLGQGQPVAIANRPPQREQAWGSRFPARGMMPQGLDWPVLLVMPSAWAGKGES